MKAAPWGGLSGGGTALVACLVLSLALPGCAGNGKDDVGESLLLGAAVLVGVGILAAAATNDDSDNDRHHRRQGGYDGGYYGKRSHRGYSPYAGNGRCDDARYRTSNGGRAESGTDEWDCRRFGDGRK